ncbi:MAG TPA: hypothetical protein PLF35_04185, partial [Prolixibacteraceae bacterium]|nr:hypothetical protein [Prolixibacteraceae bacterium]
FFNKENVSYSRKIPWTVHTHDGRTPNMGMHSPGYFSAVSNILFIDELSIFGISIFSMPRSTERFITSSISPLYSSE